MKKRDYNQFTKSDMPLDTTFQSPASSTSTPFSKMQKPKITAIGKSTQAKVKNQQRSKLTKNVSTNKPSSTTKKKLENLTESELEMLNDDSVKAISYRARRNRTIIIILIILLLLSLAAFGVFFAVSDLGANCYINLHGNVDATTYVDGHQLTMFRTPTNIQGNRIFEFDTDLKINSSGSFKVSYYIEIYEGSKLIENTQVIKENSNFTYNPLTSRYESKENIAGGERINLLEAVALDWEYEKSLNINNFKMELNIYITRV